MRLLTQGDGFCVAIDRAIKTEYMSTDRTALVLGFLAHPQLLRFVKLIRNRLAPNCLSHKALLPSVFGPLGSCWLPFYQPELVCGSSVFFSYLVFVSRRCQNAPRPCFQRSPPRNRCWLFRVSNVPGPPTSKRFAVWIDGSGLRRGLRVQLPNNHILTQNLYYNHY